MTRRARQLVAIVIGVTTGLMIVNPVAQAADTTPPSVPQNLQAGGAADRSGTVLTWSPSTDDSGVISHYWVLVDGQQRARPQAPTYDLHTLLDLGRISPGVHTVAVLAVDGALNRSGLSASVLVTVR